MTKKLAQSLIHSTSFLPNELHGKRPFAYVGFTTWLKVERLDVQLLLASTLEVNDEHSSASWNYVSGFGLHCLGKPQSPSFFRLSPSHCKNTGLSK